MKLVFRNFSLQGGRGTRNIEVLNIQSGETFEDTANVLISARGGLNQVAWPDIRGLKSFDGKLMHSGKWDEKSALGTNLLSPKAAPFF